MSTPKTGALPKCARKMLVLLGFIFLEFYIPSAQVSPTHNQYIPPTMRDFEKNNYLVLINYNFWYDEFESRISCIYWISYPGILTRHLVY